MPNGGTMHEQVTILRKIEELVDKLPYRTAEIRIELPSKTIVLAKEKRTKIGFDLNRCK